jgi:hypothetical protein
MSDGVFHVRWEQFAPYNAGQFMTLASEPGLAHAAGAWRRVVLSMGLQQIGQHPDAPLVEPPLSLHRHLTVEMNHRFTPDESPLRPFLIRQRDQTHLGLIYRHAVADSASIRAVMSAWLSELLGELPELSHVRCARAGRGVLWPWRAVAEAVREASRISRVKRVRRLPRSGDPTSPVIWTQAPAPAGLIAAVRAAARRLDVKVNDLFLAAIARSTDAHIPHERFDHRPDLCVGTIADVRDPAETVTQHFGLELGFTQTFWRWQDLADTDRALHAAAVQSRTARHRADAAGSRLRVASLLLHHRNKGIDTLTDFYRKRCPFSAGISNVNLNGSPFDAYAPAPLLNYGRVSPTGPMLPVVFTPTTLGDQLHLGLTYRAKLISNEVARLLIARFFDELQLLAKPG